MSFETDDARSSLSRINRKIRTRDFTRGLITWKSAAVGFAVGAVALVVILSSQPSPFLCFMFAIPFIMAVALPVLYSTMKGIISHLSSPKRRSRGPDNSPQPADPAGTDLPE